MTKIIRHVSELPDWFDIRHYEQWEDKNPHEAAQAVDERLWIKDIIRSGFVIFEDDVAESPEETSQAVLRQLAETSVNPYQPSINKILIEIFHERHKARFEEDYKQILSQGECDREDFRTGCLKEVQRILGYDPEIGKEDSIERVTLGDFVDWMEENKDIIDEIERSSRRLSDQYGWDIDSVRSAIQAHIPIQDSDRSDFLVVNDYPTIPTVLKRIESHLRSLPTRHNDADKARYSDVRKLFDYRIAAYADLMSWSYLTGCTVTKKCLANALFPDGRYGEIDMMPSKTVGRFIQRVENGYIEDLTAKAAEMETMQS